jgi:hypothetical protein
MVVSARQRHLPFVRQRHSHISISFFGMRYALYLSYAYQVVHVVDHMYIFCISF